MLQKAFLLLCTILLSTTSANDHLIDWSVSRPLTWEDFKAKPDPNSSNAALTSSTINVDFGFDQSGLKHSITCRFDKSQSWVKVRNAYILHHEQGHFDLSEAYARMLHKALQEYRFNKETANKDLNTIYSGVMKQLVKAQEQYDAQTNHSLDTAKQATWSKQIQGMLDQYEEFKNYRQASQ